MTLQVDPQVQAFISEPHFGVLATAGDDGGIQQAVIWYALDGDDIVINTEGGTAKARNIRRHAEVSLCLNANFRYVTISGTAQVDENPDPQLAMAITARYATPEQMQQMAQQRPPGQRVMIRIKVDKVVAWGFTGMFSLERYPQPT